MRFVVIIQNNYQPVFVAGVFFPDFVEIFVNFHNLLNIRYLKSQIRLFRVTRKNSFNFRDSYPPTGTLSNIQFSMNSAICIH